MLRRSLAVAAVAAASGLAGDGCSASHSSGGAAPAPTEGDGGDGGARGHEGGTTLRPNVVVLPDSLVASAKVSASSLDFPSSAASQLAGVSTGTVLVSGAGAGFIRKVTSVQGLGTQSTDLHVLGGGSSGITLGTAAASLTDAVLNASFDWTYASKPLSDDASALLQGTATAGWTITASLMVQPTVHVTGKIENGEFTSFAVTLTTVASDTLSEAIDWNESQSWSGSVPIDSENQRFIEFIGLVPVVATVTESMNAGYAASITADANISLGTTCSVTHTDSLTYNPADGWSADDTNTPQCTSQGPTLNLKASANAKAYLAPSLSVSFYGAGGPSLSMQIGAQGSITACPPPSAWTIAAYVSGTVGAEVSILGIGGKLSKDLGMATQPIAGGTFDTPPFCSDGGADDAGAEDAGCLAGETACPSGCSNTQLDPSNCGFCDNDCPGDEPCAGGQCVAPDRSDAGQDAGSGSSSGTTGSSGNSTSSHSSATSRSSTSSSSSRSSSSATSGGGCPAAGSPAVASSPCYGTPPGAGCCGGGAVCVIDLGGGGHGIGAGNFGCCVEGTMTDDCPIGTYPTQDNTNANGIMCLQPAHIDGGLSEDPAQGATCVPAN